MFQTKEPLSATPGRRRWASRLGALALGLMTLAGASDAGFAMDKVRVGVINAISDGTFYIAYEKGFFKDEGLDVEFIPFKASAQMVAPLGAGQLDVAAGAVAAGLYNSAARGIDMKIVADKGSMPAGYGYMPLLVRKDLVDNGTYKSFADLKKMKLGSQSIGGSAASTLNEALVKGGLKFSDMDVVYLGHAELALALQNKALGAAFVTEPHASRAVLEGSAVRVAGGDEVYPDDQLAVVLYSGDFAKTKRDVATRFMRAYIRGARFYNDALRDGHFAGKTAGEVIPILAKYTEVQDPGLFKVMTPNGVDPNGKVNVASLKKDFEFFKTLDLIKGQVNLDSVIDMSFSDAAVSTLGPYKPAL